MINQTDFVIGTCVFSVTQNLLLKIIQIIFYMSHILSLLGSDMTEVCHTAPAV
jgi:hypothetical protein